MDSYNNYLATHVLSEKEIVTYRTLSRALKVHVNLAKQMLYEFHARQNSSKPGSVHATYLISGYSRARPSTSQKSTQQDADEDTVMASSPPLPSSSMPVIEEVGDPQVPVTKSLLLVREEHLDKAKTTFSEIRGIHVYSLQAQGLSDFQALSQCTRNIYKLLREEDPMTSGAQYGQIHNAHAKRRTQKTPLPPPPVEKSLPAKSAIPQGKSTKLEWAKSTPKTATLKREGSSIAASFAKTTAKPKAKKEEEEEKPKDADTPMADLSDDDADDGQEVEIEVKAPSGKSKFDRQAELEAMMDIDDDLEDDDKKEEEAEVEDLEPPAQSQPATEQSQESVTVENGRRRGRRRVVKKKTARDPDGYLVTMEEAVWESFSEEEPAPKKAKTAAAPASTAKKGGKPGQGNIMSFFGKK